MEEYIPKEVELCADEALKTAAIAAIYRGTDAEINATQRACLAFNKGVARQHAVPERISGFEAWASWFKRGPCSAQ